MTEKSYLSIFLFLPLFSELWAAGKAEPWPGVKVTEQDVGNCWTGHEKLLALRDKDR